MTQLRDAAQDRKHHLAHGRRKALLSKYSNLLESSPRKPYADKGIWLVRPDSYVALAAQEEAIREVDAYLANPLKVAAASAA